MQIKKQDKNFLNEYPPEYRFKLPRFAKIKYVHDISFLLCITSANRSAKSVSRIYRIILKKIKIEKINKVEPGRTLEEQTDRMKSPAGRGSI